MAHEDGDAAPEHSLLLTLYYLHPNLRSNSVLTDTSIFSLRCVSDIFMRRARSLTPLQLMSFILHSDPPIRRTFPHAFSRQARNFGPLHLILVAVLATGFVNALKWVR